LVYDLEIVIASGSFWFSSNSGQNKEYTTKPFNLVVVMSNRTTSLRCPSPRHSFTEEGTNCLLRCVIFDFPTINERKLTTFTLEQSWKLAEF